MSAFESYDDHESVSPETELESFCLFEEVQTYLQTTDKVKKQENILNCAQAVLLNAYPYNDIDSLSCSVAAAYNPI